jgi:hypothetical protein
LQRVDDARVWKLLTATGSRIMVFEFANIMLAHVRRSIIQVWSVFPKDGVIALKWAHISLVKVRLLN